MVYSTSPHPHTHYLTRAPAVSQAPPCGHPGCALHGYPGMLSYTQLPPAGGYVSPPPGYSSPSVGFCHAPAYTPLPSVYPNPQTSPQPPPHPPNSPAGETMNGANGYDNLPGGGFPIFQGGSCPGGGYTNQMMTGYINPTTNFCGFSCSNTQGGHEHPGDACLMYPPIPNQAWRGSYSHPQGQAIQGSSSEEADHQVMVSYKLEFIYCIKFFI